MRRALVTTTAAVVVTVLLALLVPMAVLLREYALEDRLARAALEVQSTETVVSGQDRGAVAVHVERVNARSEGTTTTVFFPDGQAVGPDAVADPAVVEARLTGRARVDDLDGGGARVLVPVSLGGSSAGPEATPVIQVVVQAPGLGAGVLTAYVGLGLVALALLALAVGLADRLGRSFVRPLGELASYAGRLGAEHHPPPAEVTGPHEVRELAGALNLLVERVEQLRRREREGVSDLAHRLRTPVTALRLRVETVADPLERERLSADLDDLEATVDAVVREARRSEREGLVAGAGVDAVAVLAARARFWQPLAEDQGRRFALEVPAARRPVAVRASQDDLEALLDVLLDNVFSHTDEGTGVVVRLVVPPADQGGGLRLEVEDEGPGFPDGVDVARRGESGGGSTGLGLSIAARTADAAGGELLLERSPAGGARVVVRLGPTA